MYIEHFGWPRSCFNPERRDMISDPSYGVSYMKRMFARCGLQIKWCYLAESGNAYGASPEELQDFCAECDLFLNLSNVNWIPEFERCRRRVLIDTDPVFTQIGTHGFRVPFTKYHARFTYGERVHQPGCSMPTGDVKWLPTRQPVLIDRWPVRIAAPAAPFSTIINWASYPVQIRGDRVYGQKDIEFEPFFCLPRRVSETMLIAANAPDPIQQRLKKGGWRLAQPFEISKDPWTYQDFIATSRAEFCVAKQGYVTTQCGWFSDRSSAYLGMGRPVIIQDTGFSAFLPCGKGLLCYRSPDEAMAAIKVLRQDYGAHASMAREIAEEHFDGLRVLSELLERSF
jgi:hypothetical protein